VCQSAGSGKEACPAIALGLFGFGYFRARPGSRFLLQFALIVINCSTDEIFQSPLIDLVTLPLRLELNSSEGSSSEAPFAKVSFTTLL
jgi:hypothetical protein